MWNEYELFILIHAKVFVGLGIILWPLSQNFDEILDSANQNDNYEQLENAIADSTPVMNNILDAAPRSSVLPND